MDSRRALFAVVATAAALACVSSRAVNISNTWVLPEEGFPVFYRYFRDRISWYEADAVCQFHHANLVTVDSTSQYDAVRAYLKELDIINNVWIGLSRNNEKARFAWTDFRALSGDGFWQEAPPVGNSPLCVATDPAADFRWHALPCGGSEVASFICELTVPSWASGPKGCLLTELPSLTVLYVPEQSAIELTSDCGLDGTKRIACKGNADRDEMMRQLSCSMTNDDYDDKNTKAPISENTIPEMVNPSPSPGNAKSTKPWILMSNTISAGDYGTPTRHRRETENTFGPISSTQSTAELSAHKLTSIQPEVRTSPSTPINASTKRKVMEAVTTNSDKVFSTERTSIKLSSISPSEDAFATQEATNQPEEQAESFSMAVSTEISAIADDKVEETVSEDTGVINQGQLLSIMTNGTMFDVIELNETGTQETQDAELALTQDNYKASSNIESSTQQAKTLNALYTTVLYHKEPPEDLITGDNNVTEEKRKQDVTPTFKIYESKTSFKEKSDDKRKTLNDLISREDDKSLTKEIESYNLIPDLSLKLNRTFRKKLPTTQSDATEKPVKNISNDDLIIAEQPSNHKIVEIKLHSGDNKNTIKTKLFVTTKTISEKSRRIDKSEKFVNNKKKKNVLEYEDTLEKFDDPPPNDTDSAQKKEIDPRIDELNSNPINATKNIDSEIISLGSFQDASLKSHLLPKSLIEISDENKSSENSTEPQDTASTAEDPTQNPNELAPQQQKPNRQRLLTKPQRRSFYPYFFSRVLG